MEYMKDASEWLDKDEYPFKHRYFETPAGSMHYVDEGKGEPIVFVHGNPSWSFLYRKLISSLSDKYRCIAPDHIGFGMSDKPPGWSYLPEDHAKNLERLLDHLQLQNTTLILNDWGGPIGLSYAIAHPEKVTNIILTNTWLWPVNRDWHYVMFSSVMGGYIGKWLIRKFNFFANVMLKTSFGIKSRLTPEIHMHYLKPLEKVNERIGCWIFPGRIIGSTEWLKSLWEKRAILKEKNILIAWGLKDIAFREKELNVWIQSFPDSHVIRYHDTGHFVAEEMGDDLAVRIENFLMSRFSQTRLF
jgi:haloalkane dehalogenase